VYYIGVGGSDMKTTKYAIILNGEWYSSANSYEEAYEKATKIWEAADSESDFASYYGAYPNVDIVPVE
jgi:hypothetical protein